MTNNPIQPNSGRTEHISSTDFGSHRVGPIQPEECPECGGSGECGCVKCNSRPERQDCPECDGTGEVRPQPDKECPRCHGKGKVADSVLGYPDDPCYYCGGSGEAPDMSNVQLSSQPDGGETQLCLVCPHPVVAHLDDGCHVHGCACKIPKTAEGDQLIANIIRRAVNGGITYAFGKGTYGSLRDLEDTLCVEAAVLIDQASQSPMGVSAWIEHGKKYGYYDFAVGQASQEGEERGKAEAQSLQASHFKHEQKLKQALIINRSNSKCGNCSGDADPNEKAHNTKLGYGRHNGEPGCHHGWRYVTSEYIGEGMKNSIMAMRPDLEWLDMYSLSMPTHPLKGEER